MKNTLAMNKVRKGKRKMKRKKYIQSKTKLEYAEKEAERRGNASS